MAPTWPLTPQTPVSADTPVSDGFLQPVQATSGNVKISLPNTMSAALIGVKTISNAPVGGSSSLNTVTIVTTRSGDKFDGVPNRTSLDLSSLGQSVLLQYDQTRQVWYVMALDVDRGQVDSLYAPVTGQLGQFARGTTASPDVVAAPALKAERYMAVTTGGGREDQVGSIYGLATADPLNAVQATGVVGVGTGNAMSSVNNDLAGVSGYARQLAQLTTPVNGSGQTFPTGTLTVASTVGFPTSGTLFVAGVTGVVTYTGVTATTFTGCTGGSGTAVNGGRAAGAGSGNAAGGYFTGRADFLSGGRVAAVRVEAESWNAPDPGTVSGVSLSTAMWIRTLGQYQLGAAIQLGGGPGLSGGGGTETGARHDLGCGITAGSPAVIDPACVMTDVGATTFSPGFIPVGATVGTAYPARVTDLNGAQSFGTLAVDSTAGFASSGVLTIAGITGLVSYAGLGPGGTTFTGCTGGSGSAADEAAVTQPVAATDLTGAQGPFPVATITVDSTTGFAGSGVLTIAGVTGMVTYTGLGAGGTTFTGCTGGAGSPADEAAVTQWAAATDLFGPQGPFPLATITVDSTAGFASSGALAIVGITGLVSYTGTTGTTFTGCTGGSGSAADEAVVTQPAAATDLNVPGGLPFPFPPSTITVDSTTGFASPAGTLTIAGVGHVSYTGTTGTTFTGCTGGSGLAGDEALVTQPGGETDLNGAQSFPIGTITVDSTASFPGSGTLSIAGVTGPVSYTSTTLTTFTGCTGGSGSAADEAAVRQAGAVTDLNGAQTFPVGTITVDSTTGFTSSGVLAIAGVTGVVAYTGVTATTFTGCTGGSGAAADEAVVTQWPAATDVKGAQGPFPLTSISVDSTTGFAAPSVLAITGVTGLVSYTGVTGTTFSGCTGGSGSAVDEAVVTQPVASTDVNGPQTFPVGTITVDSTTGFASSGVLTIAGVTGVVSYTGTTATTLTGCTGGTGLALDEAAVTQPVAATDLTGAQGPFPVATITVDSTTGFAGSGVLTIAGVTGVVSYTGTTGTTFTGCSGGSGSPADEAVVTQWPAATDLNGAQSPFPLASITVDSTTGFANPSVLAITGVSGLVSYTGVTATTFTGCNGGSGSAVDEAVVTQPVASTDLNGAQGPFPLATVTVDSTTGFASSGVLTIAGVTGAVSYTGVTATAFTGCTGGSGSAADEAVVTQPAAASDVNAPGGQAFPVPTPTVTVDTTALFPTPGMLSIDGVAGPITYTGKTATTFTGCSGGVGSPGNELNVTQVFGFVLADGATAMQTGTVGVYVSGNGSRLDPACTITAGASSDLNGAHGPFPLATITVDSTTGFASSGVLTIAGVTGLVSYTGTTGTTFTGCTGGTGSAADEATVTQAPTVVDPACVASDAGLNVDAPGYIPAGTAIGTVVPGGSFTLQTPAGAAVTATPLGATVGVYVLLAPPALNQPFAPQFNYGLIVDSTDAIDTATFADYGYASTSILIQGTHTAAALAVAPGAGPVLLGAWGRTDTCCTTTLGSTTVIDPLITSSDVNLPVSGPSIPPGTTIATVGSGTFTITQPAIASGTAPLIIGGASFSSTLLELSAGSSDALPTLAIGNPANTFARSIDLVSSAGVARLGVGGADQLATGTRCGDGVFQPTTNSNILAVHLAGGGTGATSVVKVTGDGRLGFFNTAAAIQQTSVALSAGFVQNSGTAMNNQSTSTGNIGGTGAAYTFGDIVRALKNYGLLAA